VDDVFLKWVPNYSGRLPDYVLKNSLERLTWVLTYKEDSKHEPEEKKVPLSEE